MVYSLGFRLAAVFHLCECLASWNVKNIPPFDGSINTILSSSSQTRWRHAHLTVGPPDEFTQMHWVKRPPCYLSFPSLCKMKDKKPPYSDCIFSQQQNKCQGSWHVNFTNAFIRWSCHDHSCYIRLHWHWLWSYALLVAKKKAPRELHKQETMHKPNNRQAHNVPGSFITVYRTVCF